MVSQKEIIEALRAYDKAMAECGYELAVDKTIADRIESDGIAPKPYVPMTDDEITEATQVMKPDLLHEPTLYCWRQVEKAVIKRAGLEIKHD